MGKMIKCKGCGEEISKKAKICPKCGEPAPKKTSLLTWLVGILFIVALINYGNNNSNKTQNNKAQNKTCYNENVFELFKKAFKEQGVSIEKLYWKDKPFKTQKGTYTQSLNFDSPYNRGLVFYDKNCNPEIIKSSSGYGEVVMYYYEVKNNDLKLMKTAKNIYKR